VADGGYICPSNPNSTHTHTHTPLPWRCARGTHEGQDYAVPVTALGSQTFLPAISQTPARCLCRIKDHASASPCWAAVTEWLLQFLHSSLTAPQVFKNVHSSPPTWLLQLPHFPQFQRLRPPPLPPHWPAWLHLRPANSSATTPTTPHF
jgi:hypothetical protein